MKQRVEEVNLLALKTMKSILSTSLGPRGFDKLIVNDLGETIVTNDGAKILKSLDTENPVIRILRDLAMAQDV